MSLIVKNCPACVDGKGCASPHIKEKECADVELCVMKQLVYGCMEHMKSIQLLAPDRILQLLQVEDV